MLKPEEYLPYNLLSDVCFAGKAPEDYQEQLKNPLEHSKGYENCMGGFDEDGNLIAALKMLPYEMNFDGNIVKMCGIASVVTAPEARGTGVMSKVYEQCLIKMKEIGYVFSILFPFSYAYYRKFGYELAYELRSTKVPIECFRKYPYPKDSVKFWKKGDSIEDLKSVYNIFKQGRNYAINRSDESWGKILEDADPYINLQYTYIHYDNKGKADAYLTFKSKRPDIHDRNHMHISEFVWATKEGMLNMFGFIGGLSPQFGAIHWNVPMDIDLGSMFAEGWDVETKAHTSFMTRIVDLPLALSMVRVPVTSSGNVVLDVVDKSMPCNNGKYAVSWQNGKLTVEKTEAAPDISISIEALVQMLVGYATPQTAKYRIDTTVHGNMTDIEALFSKKTLYMWETF